MKKHSKTLRVIIPAALIVIIGVGFATNLGIGTLSAPGFWDISILCPLGALGTMLASKMMVPRAVVSLVIVCVLIILFARAFCAWMCPVPLVKRLRNLFKKGAAENPKKDAAQSAHRSAAAGAADDSETAGAADAGAQPLVHAKAAAPLTEAEAAALKGACSKDEKGLAGCASCAAKRGSVPDARHFVLGGALLSTFIFGFPVFCLVCPIGLTFATILLVINLFAFGDVTWSVIVVPLLLIAEVVLFRKWCHKICPLSAFMSLIGKANKTFVPTIDDSKCLETSKGTSCGACGRACEEGIDPRHPQLSEAAWSECSKCRACVDACPASAITMPLLPKKGGRAPAPMLQPREAVADQAAAATDEHAPRP